MQGSAFQQRGKKHRIPQVGGDGRNRCEGAAGRKLQLLPDGIYIIDKLAMLDSHPFRPARRSGREDDVSEILIRNATLKIISALACEEFAVRVQRSEEHTSELQSRLHLVC